MALTPQQNRANNRLTLQIMGAVLIVLGLWAGSQEGDSILFLGLIVGPFLLLAPDMFLN